MARSIDTVRKSNPKVSSPKPPSGEISWFYFLISLAVVIALVSAITPLILKKDTSKKYYSEADSVEDKIQNPPQSQESNETLNPTGSQTTEEPKTETTPQPQSQPTPTETPIDKASFQIKILNGTSTNGLAAKIKGELENQGFKVISVANAKTRYQTTFIYYKDNKEKEAKEVEKALSGRQITVELNNNLALAHKVEVLVVLGLK